jgi:SAM-dependent methyltransferase
MSFMNPAEFANIRKSEEHFWWYRGMRAILFRFLEPHLKDHTITHALEAGCGTGYLSQLLQKDRGWPIVPLDYSWDGLRYARELGVQKPVQGDIRSLPFADGLFDLTLSMDVLVHLPNGSTSCVAITASSLTRSNASTAASSWASSPPPASACSAAPT